MSQIECPPGVLRERLSDVVNCVKVIRVQRHRKYYNHLTFIDDIELTLVNVCNSEVSTVCIDRRYVLEYSSRFAMKIEAFSSDGRRLNILRRDEKCLLDKEPGLEYLCVRLNEAIKPGTYYTLTLTHISETAMINNTKSGMWGKLLNFLTPYYDVVVFSITYPMNQPLATWTQSQYHYYEAIPEYLEIHNDTFKVIELTRTLLNMMFDGKANFTIIAENSRNLSFSFIVPEASYILQQTSHEGEKKESEEGKFNASPLLKVLVTLLFTMFGLAIIIRLTLNGLYKAFSWLFQLLSICTIVLSLVMIALILKHINYLLDDLFILLTTLVLLLLSNYIVIPKQAPIKYRRLQLLTYAVLISIILLIATVIMAAIL